MAFSRVGGLPKCEPVGREGAHSPNLQSIVEFETRFNQTLSQVLRSRPPIQNKTTFGWKNTLVGVIITGNRNQ